LKIRTTRFGTIDVEEHKIINMPLGMLGFPNKRQFVMFPHKEDSPFFWFQSVDDPALAFVIASPFLVEPDYRLDMDGDDFEIHDYKTSRSLPTQHKLDNDRQLALYELAIRKKWPDAKNITS